MKITQNSRMIQHRLTGTGVRPTNPTSNDHTDSSWSPTDIYIGELCINVTDDKAYMRTNNGIVELATSGTSSTGPWAFASDEIIISSSLTADAVTRNTNAFTDLGSSSLRWKDLYLGGSFGGNAVINVNSDLLLRTSARTLLTTIGGAITDGATFVMATASSTGTKTTPLFINSDSCTGQGQNVTMVNSSSSSMNAIRATVLSGNTASVTANTSVYMLNGYGRTFSRADSVGIGGQLALRGVTDDGSALYLNSDNVRGQTRLQTLNASPTAIFTLPFLGANGDVVSIKLFITGRDITDITRTYTATVLLMAYADSSRNAIADDPIVNEINTFLEPVQVTAATDANDIFVYVQGTTTNTIKWLCTYEYQRLQN